MQPISPLDGRYSKKVEALRPFFSEEALMKARCEVEIWYFIFLAQEPKIRDLKKLNKKQIEGLRKIVTHFGAKDASAIRAFEKKTNHDVKAVEYFLKGRMSKVKGLKSSLEFVHFGLTSEDVNNLAYGILIREALQQVIRPSVKALLADLNRLAKRFHKDQMLSLTHGQPATPTTVGKEIAVYVDRLNRQFVQLRNFTMQGKFGGAVGTYSAHRAAYPDFNWEAFGKKFIKSLGLEPLANTTQINPHDDIAELSHMMSRINTILIDFSRDVWMYISRGVFKQKVVAGEVGSSTMPHKVNPIDFENAEGNLGISNALFGHFADKLPISRLQRDLSDSTVQRNIGVAFGYHLVAMFALKKGISKLNLDRTVLKQELDAHPEVLAEAIQTVLRKNGVTGAYEKLKNVTRGTTVTKDDLRAFIEELKLPKKDKEGLIRLCK